MGGGVADLCAVRFSARHVRYRAGRPAITDWTDVVTFAAIQQASHGVEIADLTAATGVTVPGLRRGPLRRLAEAGGSTFMFCGIRAKRTIPCITRILWTATQECSTESPR
jgi:hypothetical protein